jgi:hypothetical protein
MCCIQSRFLRARPSHHTCQPSNFTYANSKLLHWQACRGSLKRNSQKTENPTNLQFKHYCSEPSSCLHVEAEKLSSPKEIFRSKKKKEKSVTHTELTQPPPPPEHEPKRVYVCPSFPQRHF